ncbi:MAG: DUF3601 domain-containing protein [Treponema sp.]|jgi:hypothetical protein|nr:DUF3601 domain-containing protein [Treponema sp.]
MEGTCSPGISNLIEGEIYTVINEFTDYDGVEHPVGEQFEFDIFDYFPYDSGYTLYIKKNEEDKVIRLKDHQNHQAHVVWLIGRYIKPLEPGGL